MAERRRKTKKKLNEADFKPSKQEYAVAKYLRFNCKEVKETLVMGDRAHYFTGSKAVDCLLISKWAKEKRGTPALFTTRESIVKYLQSLLEKQFFYRARKLVPKRKEEIGPAAAKKSITSAQKDKKLQSNTEVKQKEKEEKPKEKDDDAAAKKKKKIKLEMHSDQRFIDSNDVYVWVYEPTSTKTFVLGLLIVIGSIGVCLFPLWPNELRLGVYYLSMAAMGFVGLILVLVIIRAALFGGIWVCTWGKHHFWLLPNLTEDCGFFESFKPFYSHKFMEKSNAEEEAEKKIKTETVEKEKKSDVEPDDSEDEKNESGDGDGEVDHDDRDRDSGDHDGNGDGDDRDSSSQESSSNGFEMVQK